MKIKSKNQLYSGLSLDAMPTEILLMIVKLLLPESEFETVKTETGNFIFEAIDPIKMMYPLIDITSLALTNKELMTSLGSICFQSYKIKNYIFPSEMNQFVKELTITKPLLTKHQFSSFNFDRFTSLKYLIVDGSMSTEIFNDFFPCLSIYISNSKTKPFITFIYQGDNNMENMPDNFFNCVEKLIYQPSPEILFDNITNCLQRFENLNSLYISECQYSHPLSGKKLSEFRENVSSRVQDIIIQNKSTLKELYIDKAFRNQKVYSEINNCSNLKFLETNENHLFDFMPLSKDYSFITELYILQTKYDDNLGQTPLLSGLKKLTYHFQFYRLVTAPRIQAFSQILSKAKNLESVFFIVPSLEWSISEILDVIIIHGNIQVLEYKAYGGYKPGKYFNRFLSKILECENLIGLKSIKYHILFQDVVDSHMIQALSLSNKTKNLEIIGPTMKYFNRPITYDELLKIFDFYTSHYIDFRSESFQNNTEVRVIDKHILDETLKHNRLPVTFLTQQNFQISKLKLTSQQQILLSKRLKSENYSAFRKINTMDKLEQYYFKTLEITRNQAICDSLFSHYNQPFDQLLSFIIDLELLCTNLLSDAKR